MTKWEYAKEHHSNVKAVAELGLGGWEAYGSVDGYILFKRPIIDVVVPIALPPSKKVGNKKKGKL